MSLPDEWAWLEEVPDQWKVPQEIAGPTAVPAINLVIRMLSSEMLGNDLVALVGEFVVEESRLNMWVGSGKGERLSMRELAGFSSMMRDCVRSIYEAWSAFVRVHEQENRMAGSAEMEEQALRSELEATVIKMREARLE